MKSKKAQLGKAITTLPVLFLIVIVMALYLALSAGATLLGDSPAKKIAETAVFYQDNLLLQEMKFEDKDMFVFDAAYITLNREKQETLNAAKPRHLLKLHETLQNQLLKEENECYLLYPKNRLLHGYVLYKGALYAVPPVEIEPTPLNELTFYIENEEISVFTYYGKCSIDETTIPKTKETKKNVPVSTAGEPLT